MRQEIEQVQGAAKVLERAVNNFERATAPLVERAHAYLEATGGYTRSSQYPAIREHDDVGPDGAYFHVSNGIDYRDDFNRLLTWEQLDQEDFEALARKHQEAKREGERTRARAELEAAQRRARELGLET